MQNTQLIDYIKCSPEKWNQQYKENKWDYLNELTELARYSIIYGYIKKNLATEGILDMGCGSGILYDMLEEYEKDIYIGVDLSAEAIKIAEQKSPNHTFYCASISDFTPHKQFDVIIFNESLQYVTDTSNVLHTYSKYLTTNGVIISSIYAHNNSDDQLAYTIITNKISEIEQCNELVVLDKVSLHNHKSNHLQWYIHLLGNKKLV